VRRLKVTQVDGNASFIAGLDPVATARDLVDDRFVRKSIAAAGGQQAFGQADGFERKEVVVV
jgi:NitT/TauT family transport system substrate-binding protein